MTLLEIFLNNHNNLLLIFIQVYQQHPLYFNLFSMYSNLFFVYFLNFLTICVNYDINTMMNVLDMKKTESFDSVTSYY